VTLAVSEPKLAANLLVPRVRWGGRPAVKSAGTVSIPPPPAIASIKPAAKATAQSSAHVVGSKANSNINNQFVF